MPSTGKVYYIVRIYEIQFANWEWRFELRALEFETTAFAPPVEITQKGNTHSGVKEQRNSMHVEFFHFTPQI